MISSEVQRTLVKSPPELWAEISDPESLARHLGDFGEIRITHVKPEQKVEWEAGDASGTVVIKPSGWGTKVKLTVTRELAAPEPAYEPSIAADDELDDEQPSAQAPEQVADEPTQDSPHVEPQAEAEAEPQAEAETRVEAETTSEEPAPQPKPEPRRGFFARLFGRRRSHADGPSAVELVEPAPEPIEDEPLSAGVDAPEFDFVDEPVHEHEHESAPSATADEPTATGAQALDALAAGSEAPAGGQTIETHEDSADAPEQHAASDDASARAKLAEELAAEEVTAVLTGVLDRLGAAHHRPFSRA